MVIKLWIKYKNSWICLFKHSFFPLSESSIFLSFIETFEDFKTFHKRQKLWFVLRYLINNTFEFFSIRILHLSNEFLQLLNLFVSQKNCVVFLSVMKLFHTRSNWFRMNFEASQRVFLLCNKRRYCRNSLIKTKLFRFSN